MNGRWAAGVAAAEDEQVAVRDLEVAVWCGARATGAVGKQDGDLREGQAGLVPEAVPRQEPQRRKGAITAHIGHGDSQSAAARETLDCLRGEARQIGADACMGDVACKLVGKSEGDEREIGRVRQCAGAAALTEGDVEDLTAGWGETLPERAAQRRLRRVGGQRPDRRCLLGLGAGRRRCGCDGMKWQKDRVLGRLGGAPARLGGAEDGEVLMGEQQEALLPSVPI